MNLCFKPSKLKTLGSEVVPSNNLTLVTVLFHFHFVLVVHLISSIKLVFVVYVTVASPFVYGSPPDKIS